MRMARQTTLVGCGLAIWLLVTGCGPNPKDLQIQSLEEQLDACRMENGNLRSQYAMAMRDRDAARQRSRSLESQVDDLRQRLAQRPTEQTPAGWQQAGGWRWIDLGTDFLFDSGRATLKPAARAKLAQVVQDIKTHYGDMMIWVVGHTDTDPIKKTKHLWKDNLDLSANRAMSVYQELSKLGIRPARMIAGGQGEHNPVAPNTNDAGKAKNRRVQIVAVPAPDGGATASGPGAASSAAGGPPSRRVPTEK